MLEFAQNIKMYSFYILSLFYISYIMCIFARIWLYLPAYVFSVFYIYLSTTSILFRYLDDDDDEVMESTFEQQMKEEAKR